MSRARTRDPPGIPPFRKLGHIPDILDYCRNQVSGGTFFFAVNLLDRPSSLLYFSRHVNCWSKSIVNEIAEKVEKRLAASNSFVELIASGGDPSQALEERFGATTQDV